MADTRIVSGGWVGSQAVSETGQRWMSAAGSKLRLPVPFWMSQLVGRSKFNVVIAPDSSGTQSGYDEGYRGSLVSNQTGHGLTTVVGYKSINYNGIRDAIVVASWSAQFSGCRFMMEGFRNNEVINLPNRGINGNNGARLYAVDWLGPELYWWFDARKWQHINGLIEFY